MFDNLFKELRNLEGGSTVSIQVAVDDDGYFDRECPAEACRTSFKVLFKDWKEKVRDEQVFCPICRHEANSGEWANEVQKEHLQAAGMAHLRRIIDNAVAQDAERFNRTQLRGGLVSMSLSYRPESIPLLVTPEAADVMRQNYVCGECGCRYATIGAAFFCPSCGVSSAGKTFEADIECAIKTVMCLPVLKAALGEAQDNDSAQDTVRLILENTQGSLVGIFQHFAERLYASLQDAPSARRNVFQNLPESSLLWKSTIGVGYEDILDSDDYTELARLFQQRHLLAHKGGIVDADYINKSGDPGYTVGQRIVVRDESVLRLARLVRKVGTGLSSRIPYAPQSDLAREGISLMTYNDVTATGAEIVAAYTRVPTVGWRELTVDELRQIHRRLNDDLKRRESQGRGSVEARMEVRDAAKTLEKMKSGARSFTVAWPDGTLVFAATKV